MVSNFKFVANGPNRGILRYSRLITLLLKRKGIGFESPSQLAPIPLYTSNNVPKSVWKASTDGQFIRRRALSPVEGILVDMPSSDSDSDDDATPPPTNIPPFKHAPFDAPIPPYEHSPLADEFAPAPMDLEGSSSHDVSWSYPPSPLSQLTARFDDFRMDVANEFREFREDVQSQLDYMRGDIRTLLAYYQQYPPPPPPPPTAD